MNNVIRGNSSNNVLDGKSGADTLIGGAGDDTYYVTAGEGDVVQELANEGTDTLYYKGHSNYTLISNVENLVLVFDQSSANYSTFSGNALDNVIDASDISGNYIALHITVNGGDGNDSIGGAWQAYNSIYGGNGNDQLSGDSNKDSLTGGLGDDTYYISSSDVNIYENVNEGTDLVKVIPVYPGGTYTLASNIENGMIVGYFGGQFDTYNLNGNALDNTLTGNAATNILNGGIGNDTLIGGNGDDTYTYNIGEGQDQIYNTASDNAAATDTLNLVGVKPTDVVLNRFADDLLITMTTSTTSSVRIKDYFASADNKIDKIKFSYTDSSSGSNVEVVWDRPVFEALVVVRTNNHIPTVLNQIANQTATEDSAFSYTVPASAFSDVDSWDILNYSFTLSNGAALPSWLSYNATTLTLSGTPTNENVGNLNLKLIATDLSGGTAEQNFSVNVLNTNDAPRLAIYLEDISVRKSQPFSYVFNLNSYFVDPDVGDALTFSATLANGSALPSWLTFNAITGAFTGTPPANFATISVKVSAKDTSNLVTYDTFDIIPPVDRTINGTANNDFLAGGSGNDTLNGLAGDDTLDGGVGDDTMVGGIGDDRYYVDSVNDLVVEAVNQGADYVISTVTYTLSSNVEELYLEGTDSINATGNALDNYLAGNDAANIIAGGAGDDTIDGYLGNDTLIGGLGSDAYSFYVGAGNDQIDNSATDNATSIDTLNIYDIDPVNVLLSRSSSDLIIAINGAADNVIIKNYFAAVDNKLDSITMFYGYDEVTGNYAQSLIWSQAYIASIFPSPTTGSDNLVGTSGDDVIDALAGNDTVSGGDGNDQLLGNAGNDSLIGGLGNDSLDGGAGNDTMVGGLGNDTYTIDVTTDVITENLNEGTDLVNVAVVTAAGTYTVAANVENATLTNTVAYNLTGNALNNVLTGNAAANVLDGGAGADTLIGGLGNETYTIDNAADVVTENLNEGTDLINSSITYSLLANVENLTLIGTSAINATGNTLNNALTGNTANNILDGGVGADTMIGGTGNDTYIVDNALDVVTETSTLATEIDTAQASVSYTLATNVENLTLTGTTAINGTGNTLANTITGNAADNVINGLAGNDTMVGGLGNDTYTIDVLTDVVTENLNEGTDLINVAIATASGTYTVAANVENATLTNTVAYSLIGNALDNVLTGNAAANTLNGGDGNDTLNGLAGNDTMIGGLGNDTYTIDVTTDVVTEAVSAGTDLVNVAVATAGGTYTVAANVENATLTNTVAYSITGNALDNVLTGNAAANTLTGAAGNDTLNGLAGNDTMVGGLGNDTYTIDATGDVVTEAASAGTDTVKVAIATASGTYTVAANVENAILTNTVAYNLTGNALANYLYGNAANNILTDTTGGNDILQGGAGLDTINHNATTGNSLIDGGSGVDTMTAGAGKDLIIGGTGNDTITTGTGFDVISFNKGDGADIINASTGADNTLSLGGAFAYSDLSLTKTGNDLILKMGTTDQVTLAGWYTATTNKSVINLQVIAEAVTGFSLGGADALRNNKIENFNFANLVAAFDTAGATANWQLTDARLTTHLLAGSDTAAIGGDLAYQYGRNSNLTGVGLIASQNVINAASFGQTAQILNAPSTWAAETVKLG